MKKLAPKRTFAETWAEGRMLLELSMLAQVDQNPLWVDVGKKKIDRVPATQSHPSPLYRAFDEARLGWA